MLCVLRLRLRSKMMMISARGRPPNQLQKKRKIPSRLEALREKTLTEYHLDLFIMLCARSRTHAWIKLCTSDMILIQRASLVPSSS